MGWLTRHVARPQYVEVVVDTALVLLDMYAHAVGQSPVMDEMLRELARRVRGQVELSMVASRIGGMVGMLVGGAGGMGAPAKGGAEALVAVE